MGFEVLPGVDSNELTALTIRRRRTRDQHTGIASPDTPEGTE